MTERTFNQIKEAYRDMGAKALYRPAAPSDGLGNISGKLDLEKECESYLEDWWEQEDKGEFFIGCCDGFSRKATIFALEACRNMCAGRLGDKTALALLKMAVKEMELVVKDPHVQQVHKVMGL